MVKGMPNVDETESRLIKRMAHAGLTWKKIQEITGRSSDTVNKHINGKPFVGPGPGQPKKVTAKDVKRMEIVADRLQKHAMAKRDVPISQVKAVAGVKASIRAVLDAFHGEGIYYRKLKERQVLKDGDEEERLTWANVQCSR